MWSIVSKTNNGCNIVNLSRKLTSHVIYPNNSSRLQIILLCYLTYKISESTHSASMHRPTTSKKIKFSTQNNVKGCSEKLSYDLSNCNNSYNVLQIAKTYANLEPTDRLTKNYVVIVCGGSRHISRNDTKTGLRSWTHFTKKKLVIHVPNNLTLK
jgi:hypothetical protein